MAVIHKELIASKGSNPEDFIYKDAKEVFVKITEGTEEGRQKNFIGRYKSQLAVDW